MNAKTRLIAAIIAALGLTASGSFAATDSTYTTGSNWQGEGIFSLVGKMGAGNPLQPRSGIILAASGRGKDGNKAEDDGVDAPDAPDELDCDVDELTGIAFCVPSVSLQPAGAILLAASGRGKDGTKPEDDGVDAPDAPDELDCDVDELTGIAFCIPSV